MFSNLITRLAGRSVEWVRNTISFNKEMNDLNRMSELELRDMGISRTDVIALAKNMRDHRVCR
jgi:uncharacterized protein YjiS (DUF1127 family)